jgi:hypothetical protein
MNARPNFLSVMISSRSLSFTDRLVPPTASTKPFVETLSVAEGSVIAKHAVIFYPITHDDNAALHAGFGYGATSGANAYAARIDELASAFGTSANLTTLLAQAPLFRHVLNPASLTRDYGASVFGPFNKAAIIYFVIPVSVLSVDRRLFHVAGAITNPEIFKLPQFQVSADPFPAVVLVLIGSRIIAAAFDIPKDMVKPLIGLPKTTLCALPHLGALSLFHQLAEHARLIDPLGVVIGVPAFARAELLPIYFLVQNRPFAVLAFLLLFGGHM